MNDGADLTLFRTDKMGREIVVFIHFREVVSPFGFLKLVTAEHNGMEVPKQFMYIPRNSLVHKWSMVKEIVDKLMYEPSNEDYFHKATQSITSMDSLFDSSTYQFLSEQFHLLLCYKQGLGTTNICIFLRQNFFSISPAAYCMVKRSEIILLPDERMILRLLSKSLSHDNLGKLLSHLRGRLHIPTLNTVYFVHNAVHLYKNLTDSRKNCSKYFQHVLSHIDTSFSENSAACRTL